MEQTTNGTVLPVVMQPTETVNAIRYHGSELQKQMTELLNGSELFTTLNANFIPDYTKEGEKSKRYIAVFTQQYVVKQIEDKAKNLRPVLRLKTVAKIAAIPKDGSMINIEKNGKDKNGNDLYSPIIEKSSQRWEAVKLEPVINLIPTHKVLAVVFIASESLTVNQFAVLAVNTLALICENNEVNGKPAPIRKTAGINLSFTHDKKQINTGKLGEGIRAGLMSTDLNRFTDLMLRKIKLSNRQSEKAEVKPGLATKLAAKE